MLQLFVMTNDVMQVIVMATFTATIESVSQW
jgi:hypothetical protein